jgi:dienelactone hydrolase
MKLMFRIVLVGLAGLITFSASAEIVSETVEYRHEGTVCEGTLVYDNALGSPLPGVLVFHAWGGAGEYEQARAKMLAEQGYVAFVADIYSKGIRPQTIEERKALVGHYYGDRAMTRARAEAALTALKSNPRVNGDKIGAIGYCFGGMVALELARSGAPLDAVATFHGSLNTPAPDDAKNIKAAVLALHGADDPYVSNAEVAAFKKEMEDGGVTFQFISYPGAVHSFSDWNAGNDNSTGAAYNEEADKASWTAMTEFMAGHLKQ